MKAMIRGILRQLGYEVRRLRKTPEERRQELLARAGVRAVIDIGAADGGYGASVRAAGFRGVILSIEPRAHAFKVLEKRARTDGNWRASRCALGATEGRARLNVSARGTSSSLLGMLPAHLAAAPDSGYVAEEDVPLRRLDTLVVEEGLAGEPLFVKIDVQGFESEVLTGAGDLLERVGGLEVELSTVPLYEHGPLFREMIDRIDDLGFSPVAFSEVLLRPGTSEVIQFDGLFSRSWSGHGAGDPSVAGPGSSSLSVPRSGRGTEA